MRLTTPAPVLKVQFCIGIQRAGINFVLVLKRSLVCRDASEVRQLCVLLLLLGPSECTLRPALPSRALGITLDQLFDRHAENYSLLFKTIMSSHRLSHVFGA